MKSFCFTIGDNIRFLMEITEQKPGSIFDHPYLAMLHRLDDQFNLKIQLNLFYRREEFNLTHMSDNYAEQWNVAADWLKLSFHSEQENPRPYLNSDYKEYLRIAKQYIGKFCGLQAQNPWERSQRCIAVRLHQRV